LDSNFFGPLSERLSSPFVSNKNIASSVRALFFSGSPITIIRRIDTFVISSLNAVVFGRSFAHVSKEVTKRIDPPVTNCDTPSTVAWVTFFISVVTPSFYSGPHAELRGVGHSVGGTSCFDKFRVKAPTRFGCAGFYAMRVYNSFVSAVTSTLPVSMLISRWILGDNSKSVESFTSKVCNARHNTLRQNIRKLVEWQPDTVSGVRSLNLATGEL